VWDHRSRWASSPLILCFHKSCEQCASGSALCACELQSVSVVLQCKAQFFRKHLDERRMSKQLTFYKRKNSDLLFSLWYVLVRGAVCFAVSFVACCLSAQCLSARQWADSRNEHQAPRREMRSSLNALTRYYSFMQPKRLFYDIELTWATRERGGASVPRERYHAQELNAI